MNRYKVFVLSISAISKSESNGRILKNILPASDKIDIFNVYVSGEPYDCDVKYLHLSDKSVLKSFLSFGIRSPIDNVNYSSASNGSLTNGFNKKTPLKYLLRNLVWKLTFKTRKICIHEAIKFQPDFVFVMAANMPFIYDVASRIANKTSARLVIYSAEDYPLKKYDYMSGEASYGIITRFVQRNLFRTAQKAYNISSFNIYNSSKLMDSYLNNSFGTLEKSRIIRLPSELHPILSDQKSLTILYAGNLSEERCKSILEIADCLTSLKLGFHIDVYGRLHFDKYLSAFKKSNVISYRGFIPFNKLKKEFLKASFLLNVEGFSDYTKLDYKHGFSTKIADCLMLNVPLICYGSQNIAGVDFLLSLNPDFTIVEKNELSNKLDKILNGLVKYSLNVEEIRNEFYIDCVRNNMYLLFSSIDKEHKI